MRTLSHLIRYRFGVVALLAQLASPGAAAQSPTEATVAEINRATDRFIEALNTLNLARVDSLLAPGFVYQPLGFMDVPRPNMLEMLRARSNNPRLRRQLGPKWEYRDVLAHGSTAVFNGQTEETRHVDNRNLRDECILNLVWTREGNRWQLLHMLQSAGGPRLSALTWNKVFQDSVGFELRPNRFLEQSIKGLQPGTALDIAMGQGRNALLLARQGWRVTGIDVADEGIRIAQSQAAREKLKLEMQVVDSRRYDFGKARWDLVAMIYYGELDQYLDRIYAGLRPGGTLVFEGFPGQALSVEAGTTQPPKPEALRPKLEKAGFTIVTFTSTTDQADYGLRPAPLVRLVARKPK